MKLKTLLMLFATLLSSLSVACAQSNDALPSNDPPKKIYGENFQDCEAELGILENLDSKAYEINRTKLDEDVNRATRYLLIRSTVGNDIQKIMDNIHQANIAKSCQQIHQSVYAALLKEAEIKH